MRIVPDTGILVRSTAKATGPARALLVQIKAQQHTLILSLFLLNETKRVLRYPRMQRLYGLNERDIENHVQFLQEAGELVNPVVATPVVLSDPNDDPVIYTAVEGRADVLCTLDRDFYTSEVRAFCRQRGIQVMSDVELLQKLRAKGVH